MTGLPRISDGAQHRVRAALTCRSSASAHRLLVVVEGAVTIEDGSRRRRLDPPVLAWLPPGWPGSLRVPAGAFWYRIDLDAGSDLADRLGCTLPLVKAGPAVRPWHQQVVAMSQQWWRDQVVNGRCAARMLALLAELAEDDQPGERQESDDLVERFQRLVEDYIGSDERIDALAARLGTGRGVLDRAMRAATGQSAAGWLRGVRMRMAADMLTRQQGSTGHVARVCGFRHEDSFAIAFRRTFRKSPAAWRRSATT